MIGFHLPAITFRARSAGSAGKRFIGSAILTSRYVSHELVCSPALSDTPISASSPTEARDPTMKAVQLSRFGGVEALDVVDVATPEPGPSQVRIKCRAIGVNFADTLIRQDRYAVTPDLPAILGSEAAGV